MKWSFGYGWFVGVVLLLGSTGWSAHAQNVEGVVMDESGESLPGVNVLVVETQQGTVTDAEGAFALDVSFDEVVPVQLRFSFIGFEAQTVTLDGPTDELEVTLREEIARGDEVIVSASRVDERVLEVPVTVGRLSGRALAARPAIDLVSSMESMPGIDVSRSSLLVNSPSTRGFNSTKSERVIQLADYVDFVAPSLSVYSGNTSGPPRIDLESVDVIHGASSALYGPNAFNGVIIMNTRDAFTDQGLDLDVRGGTREMVDVSGRFAEGFFDNRVAVKLVGRFMQANEFISSNFDAQSIANNNAPDDARGFAAVNRYGDLNLSGIDGTAEILQDAGINTEDNDVFMPGYTEEALVGSDLNASTWQINPMISAHLFDDVRATYWYRFSSSEGIYQSNSRFRWDGITVSTNAFELEGNDWLVRAYRTADNSGDSFDINLLGSLMNAEQSYQIGNRSLDDMSEAERNRANFMEGLALPYAAAYALVYGDAYEAAIDQGMSPEEAFAQAQEAASGVLPEPGQDRFDTARTATLNRGADQTRPTFDINSTLYHAESQYTLDTDLIEATVGGNYRQYRLTSAGTLFADGEVASPINSDGTREVRDGIDNYEYGGFLRLQRGFFNDRFTLSAVGRVDEFKNFDTQFSPRVSGVLTLGEDREHNFRVNYASAFRPPAQLDQHIYLDVGPLLLRGNVDDGYTGANPTEDLAEQVQEGTLFEIDPLDVEQMESVEVGYKTRIGGLFADISYYRSNYSGFIGTREFIGKEDGSAITEADLERGDDDPLRPRLLRVWLNADEDLTTQGIQTGLEYQVNQALRLRGNYTWSTISDDDLGEGVSLGFNTPEHKFNVGVWGNVSERFTYHTNLRWHDDYQYQMPFAEGPIDAQFSVDAQVGYTIPRLRTTVMLGGTNLADTDYVSAYGAAPIGRMVYMGVEVSY